MTNSLWSSFTNPALRMAIGIVMLGMVTVVITACVGLPGGLPLSESSHNATAQKYNEGKRRLNLLGGAVLLLSVLSVVCYAVVYANAETKNDNSIDPAWSGAWLVWALAALSLLTFVASIWFVVLAACLQRREKAVEKLRRLK